MPRSSGGGGRVEQLDTRAVVQGLSRHPLDLAGAPETVQLWPHRHGTDAMFIALVRRTGGGCRGMPLDAHR